MYCQVLLCYIITFLCVWILIFHQISQIEIKISRLKSLEEGKYRPHHQKFLTATTTIEYPGCPICRSTADAFLKGIKLGSTDAMLKNFSRPLCQVLQIYDQQLCTNLIDLNFDIMKYVILNSKFNLTGELICGIMLQDHNCKFNDTTPTWSVNIDKTSPMIILSKNFIPDFGYERLTILHITDTHLDPNYKAGTNAECPIPVCCRDKLELVDLGEKKAGKWGDYRNCDSPRLAIEDMIKQIRKTHKNIDVIYATGDFVDHAVWETTLDQNIRTINRTINGIRQRFQSVPFYPVLGNHEPHPVNIITPHQIALARPEFSTQPLYTFLSRTWNWLPKSARKTIKFGGYYTALVRPGYRIIALNNNACMQFNFWTLLDSSVFEEELQWLHDTLLDAEKNREKVHLLYHVPSGDTNCYRRWAQEFKRIVQRFWDTISGQFIGHAHRDQFHLYYERDNPKHAINVAWNGGSGTAYGFVNPNYRIYTVESESFQVIDHETWIYNLTEANANFKETPKWFKEYSFRQAFNVPNLSPATLHNLVTESALDPSTLELYWQYYIKQSDLLLAIGCDKDCLSKLLCNIVTTEYNADAQHCNRLLQLYWNSE